MTAGLIELTKLYFQPETTAFDHCRLFSRTKARRKKSPIFCKSPDLCIPLPSSHHRSLSGLSGEPHAQVLDLHSWNDLIHPTIKKKGPTIKKKDRRLEKKVVKNRKKGKKIIKIGCEMKKRWEE